MFKKYWAVAAVLVVLGTFGNLLQRNWSGPGIPGTGSSTLTEPESKSAPGPERRQEAPDIVLNDLNDKAVRLADFKGKVVLVDFWATWCGPCLQEIPHFKTLHERYSDQGLVILGVSLDEAGPDHVRSFVDRKRIPYLIVMGDQKAKDGFGGVTGIPTTFLIDREGMVVKKMVGYHSLEIIESAIKEVL